jgi:hypothetical protein
MAGTCQSGEDNRVIHRSGVEGEGSGRVDKEKRGKNGPISSRSLPSKMTSSRPELRFVQMSKHPGNL